MNPAQIISLIPKILAMVPEIYAIYEDEKNGQPAGADIAALLQSLEGIIAQFALKRVKK
jgi:hypothetical protein